MSTNLEAKKVPQSPLSPRIILGHVKWFNNRLGYGFIKPLPFENMNKPVFFHKKDIQFPEIFRSLDNGQLVSFETRRGERGLVACKVLQVEAESFRAECEAKGLDFEANFKWEIAPPKENQLKQLQCFNCGDFGQHLASHCLVKKAAAAAAAKEQKSPQASPQNDDAGVRVPNGRKVQLPPISSEIPQRMQQSFQTTSDCSLSHVELTRGPRDMSLYREVEMRVNEPETMYQFPMGDASGSKNASN